MSVLIERMPMPERRTKNRYYKNPTGHDKFDGARLGIDVEKSIHPQNPTTLARMSEEAQNKGKHQHKSGGYRAWLRHRRQIRKFLI